MTRAEAKAITLANIPRRLQAKYDGMSCFKVFAVIKAEHGLELTDIPVLNDEFVVQKVLEISKRTDFVEWAEDPFTGQVNIQIR